MAQNIPNGPTIDQMNIKLPDGSKYTKWQKNRPNGLIIYVQHLYLQVPQKFTHFLFEIMPAVNPANT
jgi:hypothetical protein